MNRNVTVPLFIITNICCVFLHIHKRSMVISESFRTQKIENLLSEIHQQEAELAQHLLALQDRASIKQFAQEKLQMEPIKLSSIKKLNNHAQRT